MDSYKFENPILEDFFRNEYPSRIKNTIGISESALKIEVSNSVIFMDVNEKNVADYFEACLYLHQQNLTPHIDMVLKRVNVKIVKLAKSALEKHVKEKLFHLLLMSYEKDYIPHMNDIILTFILQLKPFFINEIIFKNINDFMNLIETNGECRKIIAQHMSVEALKYNIQYNMKYYNFMISSLFLDNVNNHMVYNRRYPIFKNIDDDIKYTIIQLTFERKPFYSEKILTHPMFSSKEFQNNIKKHLILNGPIH